MPAAITLDEPPALLKLLANDVRWAVVSALTRSDYRVHELARLASLPLNLVSYHLKKLRDERLVRERRSGADGRDVYYSLDHLRLNEMFFAAGQELNLPANHNNSGKASHEQRARKEEKPLMVLFLCTHNSARSQLAEGIMRSIGGDAVEVSSAGTEPSRVHPDAVRAAATLGIDISGQSSKHLNEFRGQQFDYIITVCDRARESCPIFPGDPVQIHWSFPDPAAVDDPDERLQAFLKIGHELRTRVQYLLEIMEHDRREKAHTRATDDKQE
jgi:ArsR family transcriptional regulator, arsenate/arsenite/antimonite-responsive transcriptional repressor / arsenate reductase (thioredoxin)